MSIFGPAQSSMVVNPFFSQQFYWADPRSALCGKGTFPLNGFMVGVGRGGVNGLADGGSREKGRAARGAGDARGRHYAAVSIPH